MASVAIDRMRAKHLIRCATFVLAGIPDDLGLTDFFANVVEEKVFIQ